MRPDSHPASASFYTNWPSVMSVAGLAEPRTGIQQSTSKMNGTLCVQVTLKNRKTGKFPMETGGSTGSHTMEKETMMDESELTASLALSEE